MRAKTLRSAVVMVFMLTLAETVFAAGMSVQVRSAQVRSRPSFLGRVITELGYGERVEPRAERKGWVRIDTPRGAGWLHGSALTRKRIRWRSSGSPAATSASADELALAGKGFTPEVEKEFRRRNRTLDFTWVDRMEKIRITPDEMAAFLKDGGLHPPGEGGGR